MSPQPSADAASTSPVPEPPGTGNEEDVLSLSALFLVFWKYRAVLLATTVALVGLLAAGGLWLYTQSSSRRQATLAFRLDFAGADKGHYPNGQKFDLADIVATPVLSRVFEDNGLKRYTTYKEFKNSLFVLESNTALEKLEEEYKAKLADKQLNPKTRRQLETEFANKKKSLGKSDYALIFSLDGSPANLPQPLVAKTLGDILKGWVSYAENEKGALRYQVTLYTHNLFTDGGGGNKNEDLAGSAYIMRENTNKLLRNMDDLLKLPAARNFRVDKNGPSLPEIRARVENIRRFQLMPLIERLGAQQRPADLRSHAAFLRGVIAQLEAKRQEKSSRAKALEEALRLYTRDRTPTAVSKGSNGASDIHQFGESFLERIMDLASLTGDAVYRQKTTDEIIRYRMEEITAEKELHYYQNTLEALEAAANGKASEKASKPEASKEELRAGLKKIRNLLVAETDHISALYEQLSRRNLNQQGSIYTVLEPMKVKESSTVSWRRYGALGLLIFILAEGLLAAACLVAEAIRRKSAAARAAAS